LKGKVRNPWSPGNSKRITQGAESWVVVIGGKSRPNKGTITGVIKTHHVRHGRKSSEGDEGF
jgi:hypothetical protein